ncbi:MAG TPA: universal stress protein [Chitinophagaceae bacterium]|nr:universal stress protein [Chitinophagaceae bacterium]
MKKILIALDYNPDAQKVAETGYFYANAAGAQVALVHIITDPEYYAIEYSPIMGYAGFYSQSSNKMLTEIKEEAKKFLAASANHLGNGNIETHVLEGDTADSILDFGKEWKADLIVMGSHRHSMLQKILSEDTAAYILKHSTIPLLIIPTREK